MIHVMLVVWAAAVAAGLAGVAVWSVRVFAAACGLGLRPDGVAVFAPAELSPAAAREAVARQMAAVRAQLDAERESERLTRRDEAAIRRVYAAWPSRGRAPVMGQPAPARLAVRQVGVRLAAVA